MQWNSHEVNTTERPIRIAIQQKGRLRDASSAYLASRGIVFLSSSPRALIASCAEVPVEAIYVRNGDIPKYVQFGVADFGIVGENILFEQDIALPIVTRLPFGQCSLVIAGPEGRFAALEDLSHERIATKYPNSLRKFLEARGIDASIIELKGSVEIAPQLGLADAICDITQTGATLQELHLTVVASILDSQAVVVESPYPNAYKKDFIDHYLPVL